MRNSYNNFNRLKGEEEKETMKELYVSLREDKDKDFRVVQQDDGSFEVTELPDGKP